MTWDHRYWLTTSTFGGIVPGATHWFGRITWIGEDGRHADSPVGDYARYTRLDSVLRAARAWFHREARRRSVMTLGHVAVIDPQRIVACAPDPRGVMRRANAVWRRFEAVGGWGVGYARHPEVHSLCDEWDRLMSLGRPRAAR